jgi:hypothetical protein
MKRVKEIEYDSSLIFTEEEFDKIKLVKKNHTHWEFLNKLNYNNKNFISIWKVTNTYQSHLFEIYKFPNYYIVNYINGFSKSLWKYDTIDELIENLINF